MRGESRSPLGGETAGGPFRGSNAREGIEAQYDGNIESPDEVKGRVARRKARYATAISEASSWRSRVIHLGGDETLRAGVSEEIQLG